MFWWWLPNRSAECMFTEIKKKSFRNLKCASSRSELCEQLLSKTCNVNYKSKRSYFTLWVSRNLLISRDIRSLLSSSMSIVLMSSWRDRRKEYRWNRFKKIFTSSRSQRGERKAGVPLLFSPFSSFVAVSLRPVKARWVRQRIPASVHRWRLWQSDPSSSSPRPGPLPRRLLRLQPSCSASAEIKSQFSKELTVWFNK